MTDMRVGIIGTGPVGRALGGRLRSAFPVAYGSKRPKSYKVQQLLALQPGTTSDTIPNVVKWSTAVILAKQGAHGSEGIQELAASLGPDVVEKVVIDVTNPLTEYPGLEVRWNGRSGGEVLAEALPGAMVYKALNILPYEHMQSLPSSLTTQLNYCSNNYDKRLTQLFAGPYGEKYVVEKIIWQLGFKPEYVGPIRYARNLEAMAELVIHLSLLGTTGGAAQWGRNFHFQALRAPPST